MDISLSTAEDRARLVLRGRFDFSCHREFRRKCDAALAAPGAREIVLDFGEVDYLDSSALGMLLNLREQCSAAARRVSLENCRGLVAEVLGIANFGKLFRMS